MHSIVEEDLTSVLQAGLDWNRFRNKTVLVTGGSGFLPAYMVETLLLLNARTGTGCRVVCLVRNLSKAAKRFAEYASRTDLILLEGDVSKPFSIPWPCDFIIHAASQASPKFYGVDPVGTMTANLNGTHQLLEMARGWGSEGFLFFSSGEVYGQVDPAHIPTRENQYGYLDCLAPRSCYAESKRAAETMVASYVQQYNLPAVIVRPFHTYGPGMTLDDGRVYADFVNDIVCRRDISLHSDGKAIRAFCYLGDATAGFFTVLLKGRPGQAYNVGNPAGAISIGDLADLLTGLVPELGLKVNRLGKPGGGYLTSPISINSPDIELISQLGWRPAHSPAQGFKRTLRHFTES